MATTWAHHEVEYTLPVVNGLAVPSVPRWITAGIKNFATYGSVSYGTAQWVRQPPSYVLTLRDPNNAQECRVLLLAFERDDGTPVLVVSDVDDG